MNKHRNEDSALTAVFGVLTVITTATWAFIIFYDYFPTLFFFEYPFIERESVFTVVISFLSLIFISIWLYLIYPWIGFDSAKERDRQAQRDKILNDLGYSTSHCPHCDQRLKDGICYTYKCWIR
jgi:uncharacterized membrane protein